GRVEDFLFDLRVHRQLMADLLGQVLLLLGGAARLRLAQLLVFLEHFLDRLVVGVQQVASVLGSAGGWHDRFSLVENAPSSAALWPPAVGERRHWPQKRTDAR